MNSIFIPSQKFSKSTVSISKNEFTWHYLSMPWNSMAHLMEIEDSIHDGQFSMMEFHGTFDGN